MNIQRTIILAIVILGCLTMPAMAGEKYLYGSPELNVVIDGTNEFHPGDEVAIKVMIENKGLNTVKIVGPTIINRDDQPNIAKQVKAGLEDGDAPLTVKSDRQLVGDITGGSRKMVVFNVRFDKNAPPGEYTLPLKVEYTWLYDGEQYGFDTMTYTYNTKEKTLPLVVRIKPEARISVSEVMPRDVNVGTEGYLDLKIENTGHEFAKKAVVKITRSGDSPVIPTDGRVYIGDFAPGEVASCQFKVAVSKDAEPQTYPLSVSLEYENEDGDTVDSDSETIGVPVKGKIDFEITSQASTISPGQKGVLEVTYKNTGDALVRNAQARISAVDPFTSNDDTAFLGDMAPGEEKKARYEVSVESDGTIKEYGLDTEIRYRDALDNSQISDSMKVEVSVVKRTQGAFMSNPILITVLIVVIIGAGYYIWSRRKQE